MLPNVAGDYRRLTLAYRASRVMGRDDLQRAVLRAHQPGPSAAEVPVGDLTEFFLERLETAEAFLDRIRHRSRGLAAFLGTHRFPVEGVIPVLLRVVEERSRFRRLQNLFERSACEFGAHDQFVELGDVGLVMLAVMIFKRLGGDMGFQRVHTVWKVWKFKSHMVKYCPFGRGREMRCVAARLRGKDSVPKLGVLNPILRLTPNPG